VLNETLAKGVTVVMDRYAFSGVAFSSAKQGMDLQWCMQPDAGLPAPDILLHLELGASEVYTRLRREQALTR
jgi:dTMP kinase